MDETSNDRYAPSGRQRESIRNETGGENIGPPTHVMGQDAFRRRLV